MTQTNQTNQAAEFSIKESWANQVTKSKDITDIYNLTFADPEHIAQTMQQVIASSFFLPRNMLEAEEVLQVSQLSIFNQEDFLKFWHLAGTDGDSYKHCDVHPKLIVQAKNVGVSARWYQGHLFIVCKVWYGNPPELPETSGPKTHLNYRLHKLMKFCKFID